MVAELLDAHAIDVAAYDLTLIWPFLLRDESREREWEHNATGALARAVEWIASESGRVWKPREEDRPYPARAGDWAESEYSEYVYFHAFARNLLYSSRADVQAHRRTRPDAHDDQTPNRNMRVLERTDLKDATLEIGFELANGEFVEGATDWRGKRYFAVTVPLDVRQAQLYLFDTRVGLLVLKLHRDTPPASGRPLPERFTLQTVLKLQDVARRLYAPYWQGQPWGGHQAGHCPDRLVLRRPDRADLTSHFGTCPIEETDRVRPGGPVEDPATRRHRDAVLDHREPYAVELWAELIKPLEPIRLAARGVETRTDCLRYEQIEDERLLVFSYLAVPAPRRITPGDWLRLAMVEDPGDSSRFPYSPQFQDETEFIRAFCYDRFWCEGDSAPNQSYYQTRWLCSGHGFTGVGRADDTGFFRDVHAGARCHFRHHYFKLGLIAHFHRASLLGFKHRLSDAVEELRRDGTEAESHTRYERALRPIERDFLAFRASAWFPEVSNQVQARELFALFRRHLATDELFAQVSAEVGDATRIVSGWNQDRQRRVAEQLTVLGGGFLLLAPLAAGMVFSPDHTRPVFIYTLGSFLISAGGLLVMLGAGPRITRWLEHLVETQKVELDRPRGSIRARPDALIVLGVLVLIACVVMYCVYVRGPTNERSEPAVSWSTPSSSRGKTP